MFIQYLIVFFLVALSGLFSGLTIGLIGLNKFELKRKIKLGFKEAKMVYAVRRKGNLLLCTLLLGNVAVNSILSIFLGSIASGFLAGLIATGLIVIFGEILPTSVCSKYALKIGAKTVWLVKIFIFILYPVCWPLSKILDKILGEEIPTIWSRREIKEIVKFHEDSPESKIDADEEKIIIGALSFSDKTVARILTPRKMVFALELNTLINKKLLNQIRKNGFTRIPVYEKELDEIVGILYAKNLIGNVIGKKIKDVYEKNNSIIIKKNKKLDDLLNEFKKRKAHIALVYNEYKSFEGIVTLEDIIEEIIGDEIVDESDEIADLRKEAIKITKKRRNNL